MRGSLEVTKISVHIVFNKKTILAINNQIYHDEFHFEKM